MPDEPGTTTYAAACEALWPSEPDRHFVPVPTHEDLMNFITRIDTYDTPFLTMLNKRSAP